MSDKDIFARNNMSAFKPVQADVDVAIIGGGMSGIGLAVQLKRKYKGVTFKIFEKLDDIGGTWAINTYPGCGVDVSKISSMHWIYF
jgi:cation diffusion facilitator CzcD-associated flavoprotein CzcO